MKLLCRKVKKKRKKSGTWGKKSPKFFFYARQQKKIKFLQLLKSFVNYSHSRTTYYGFPVAHLNLWGHMCFRTQAFSGPIKGRYYVSKAVVQGLESSCNLTHYYFFSAECIHCLTKWNELVLQRALHPLFPPGFTHK